MFCPRWFSQHSNPRLTCAESIDCLTLVPTRGEVNESATGLYETFIRVTDNRCNRYQPPTFPTLLVTRTHSKCVRMQCAYAFKVCCIAVTNDTQRSPLENEFKQGFPFADDLIAIKRSRRESLAPLSRVTKRTVGVLWQHWWTNWSLPPDLPSLFVFSCFHAFLRAMFPTESIQFKGTRSST